VIATLSWFLILGHGDVDVGGERGSRMSMACETTVTNWPAASAIMAAAAQFLRLG
jgi:hypothetical protein